jgi:hypothetical protein
MNHQPTYIEENRAETERLEIIASHLNETELRQCLADGGSVAALLAHLAFWDRRALGVLKKWQKEGVTPELIDPDPVNEALLGLCEAVSPWLTTRLAIEAAREVDQAIEHLTPQLLAEIEQNGTGLRLNRALHRREHLDEIEEALKSG